MKNSGGKTKKVYKLKKRNFLISSLLVLGVFMITLGGLFSAKSIMSNLRNFFDENEKLGEKNISPNKIGEQFDGTYKLSLTVTGDAVKNPSNVNIIVIVDRSGSMDEGSGTGAYVASNSNAATMYGFIDGEYRRLTRQSSGYGPGTTYSYWYNGEQYTGQRYIYDSTATRLEATQAAVNGLANTLLGYNGKDGNPDDVVEMALVSFATTARTDRTPTTSASDFVSSVNSLNANGGTNWESALQEANEISFGANDNDPTYVIFFSDGSPTFHSTNGGYNNWNRDYGVYGSGGESEPNMERSYTQAVDDASALATKYGANNFYTIFAYGTTTGSTYMKSLTTAAGAPATNNYSASSTAELQEAFAAILEEIEMSGIGNVDIVDGTTNKVATSSGVAELLEIDKNSFQYWRTKDGVRTEWKSTDDPAPPAASFDEETGEVKWDLSSLGVLENDVTYEVTFDVYPSQETYDLIADLKNGEVDYDTEVDPAIKQYLHKNGNSYSLDTNTKKDGKSTATITYTDTRTEDGEQTYTYTNPEPVATDASSISIQKTWENSLDSREHLPVQVNLQRDGENFYPATLNSNNDWKATDIAIAVGLARLNGDTLTVLDAGHDYKFAELGSESFNWELETETVHPMLINGEIKKLILVEDESTIPSGMGNKTYYDGYYKIGNKVYKDEGINPTIHAINHRRSNLNIKKVVNGENANPNDEFEFTITLVQKDKEGKEIADDTSTTDDDLWFSVYDGGYVDLGSRLVSSGWAKEVNEAGDIYYHAPNHTQLVVKLKANENLRFVNVVSNTDFTVVEGNTTNYELAENGITASGFSTDSDSTDSTTINTNTKTITGHIGESNNSYQIEYKNKNTNPETTEATVKKVWDDAENQDGKRPETLTVTLSDGQTATLSESNNWEATITGLPKWKNGEEVEYTWTEETLPAGYEMTSNKTEGLITTITNKHVPELTEATIVKAWDDDKDRDKVRPTTLKVTLTSSDPDFEAREVTLSKDDWTETIANLPKYEHGHLAVYTWTEDTTGLPEGYSLSDTSINGTVTTLTNHRDIDTTTATVKKVWDDANNQDNKRPTTISAQLKADGVAVQKDGKDVVVELTAGNGWTATVEDLPLNNNGEAINYTWSEDETGLPAGYKLTGTSKEGTVTTLTNSYTPEKDKITVTKIWKDASDQDGKRPDDVTFTVTGSDGKTYPVTFTGEDDTWTKEVEVDKYYNEGQPVTFTVDENKVSGYTKEIDNSKLTITNSYTPEKDKIIVTKIWKDASDQDGKRPDDVTFTVTGSDGKTYPVTFTGEGDTWTKEVEVDKYYNEGQPVTFKVDENKVSGYEKSIDNENLTITNSYTPEKDKITVTKIWDDASDQDGKRPNDVTFTVTGSDGKTYPVTFTGEDDTWTKEVEVDKYYNEGQAVTFTVDENAVSGYTKEIDNENLTITNSYTPETTEATIIKIWEDDNNRDNVRPESLPVSLNNGVASTDYSLKPNAKGDWELTISNLPKYREGKEITYTWTESEDALPDGYELTKTSKEGTVTTLTNSRDIDTTTATIVKVWDDAGNQDGKRPATLNVVLHSSDETYDDVPVELKASENWTATINDLPKNVKGKVGEEVVYTWTEDEKGLPEGYELTSNTAQGTITTITNSYSPETTEASIIKVWDDANDQDGKRPEKLVVSLSNGTDFELTEENGWSAKAENLPKYKNGGEEIKYTWTENEEGLPEGYKLTGNSKTGTVTTLTNSYTPEKDKITVTKIWDDASNQDGKRPSSVAFTVTGSDDKTYGVSLTGEGDTWTKEVEVDKYQDGGQAVTFTVDEANVAGYTKAIDNQNLTITNSYTPEKDTITVTKIWDDASDQDGKRPEDVEFTVTGSDDKTYPVTLSGNGDTWTKEVEVDKYYNGGQAVTFTVDEADVAGYTKEIDNKELTITNSYSPETTESTVVKVWEDDGDRDGKQPATLDVQLKANGAVVQINGEDVVRTLNANNQWTATVTGLPKYENHGQEIDYRWSETTPDEYTMKSAGKEGQVVTITNHYDPELTYVCVKKVWDDDEDRDNIRPGSLTVVLNDGTEVVLNEQNGWAGRVDNLFKYQNHGQLINYTWTEKDLPEGYELTNSTPTDDKDDKTGLTGVITTLTNTHDIELTEATVKKVWDDADDQDGKRPETLSIKLLGDGKAVQKDDKDVVVTLSESTEWSATVEGLPLNDKGTAIKYTWEEVDLPDTYELTDTSKEGTVTTLTNTHTPEKIDIPVKKEWVNNDPYGFGNPASVVVNLLDNGKVVGTKTLSAGNNWTDTFTGLDKYRDGQEIPYEVKEEAVLDYDTEYQGSIAEGFTVVNTYNPTLIPIEVTKTWDDANDQDGVRPETIKMTLIGKVNGEVKYTSKAETVTDADYQNNNTWKHTFTDLPKRYLGQEIEYSVVETLADDSPYTGTSVTDLEIKNVYEPQTITFNIFKDWDDNDNNDGKRPESITVHLLKDGTEIETSTITEENGWAISFGPLPKFRDHGVEIDYTVIEDPVEYYENTDTIYNKDSERQTTDAIVINTHENEKAKIEITKIWKDDNNKYNYRPNSIEVEIYADGELAKTVTLNASNNWKIVVTDLDKYAAGKEIEYTIKEKAVAHYTTAIAGTAEDGFTITNTVENPPEITPPNTSIEGIGEAATDKYLALLMTILAMFASAGIRRVFE